MIPKPLAVFIVCCVTAVWIGNFAAQFIVTGYQVDGWVHTIFLSVVGGALVASRKPSSAELDHEEEQRDPAAPPELPQPPAPPRRGGSHRADLTLLILGSVTA